MVDRVQQDSRHGSAARRDENLHQDDCPRYWIRVYCLTVVPASLADIRIGDVIVYSVPDNDGEADNLVHRIVATARDGLAALMESDCVVIITDHKVYDWERVASKARLIVDTRNVLPHSGSAGKVVGL